jgi:hypothetical protein
VEVPTFEEQGGTVVVTFRAPVRPGAGWKPERDQVVTPLLDAGWLEMTISDKPRSSKQRYRTTEAGMFDLAEAEGGE